MPKRDGASKETRGLPYRRCCTLRRNLRRSGTPVLLPRLRRSRSQIAATAWRVSLKRRETHQASGRASPLSTQMRMSSQVYRSSSSFKPFDYAQGRLLFFSSSVFLPSHFELQTSNFKLQTSNFPHPFSTIRISSSVSS